MFYFLVKLVDLKLVILQQNSSLITISCMRQHLLTLLSAARLLQRQRLSSNKSLNHTYISYLYKCWCCICIKHFVLSAVSSDTPLWLLVSDFKQNIRRVHTVRINRLNNLMCDHPPFQHLSALFSWAGILDYSSICSQISIRSNKMNSPDVFFYQFTDTYTSSGPFISELITSKKKSLYSACILTHPSRIGAGVMNNPNDY